MMPAQADKDAMVALAKQNAAVAAALEGTTLVKLIAVPGRLMNFVVKA